MNFYCKNIGLINADINDVSYFFKHCSKELKTTFNLKEKKFNKIFKFKVQRGGFSITVKKNKDFIAGFTLTNANNNFLELGDVAKFNFRLSRQAFASIIKWACNEIKSKVDKNGVVGYPNKDAINLEIMAGFEIKYKYKRHIYFVFFIFCILLPFEIINKKFFLIKNYFLQSIFKINKNLVATSLKKFCLFTIYAKKITNDNNNSFIKPNFGFLYDFVETKIHNHGDEVLVFNYTNCEPKLDIGFEWTDNSA